MNCPICNSPLEDGLLFCTNCGANMTPPQNSAQTNNDPLNNPQPNIVDENNNYQNINYNYPPNFYNNQFQYDAGESNATVSMICGILSLFFGPILAIISLVFASKYKKTGNGQNIDKIKTGKICSWISIALTIAVIIIYIVLIGLIAFTFSETVPEYPEYNYSDYGDYDYYDDYDDYNEHDNYNNYDYYNDSLSSDIKSNDNLLITNTFIKNNDIKKRYNENCTVIFLC